MVITLSDSQEMYNLINGRHNESKLDSVMIYIGSFGFPNVILEYVDVSEGDDKLLKRYRKRMAHCDCINRKHSNTARPELQQILSELQEVDVVLRHEISCLSHSVKDLLTMSIKEKGASLKSLNESWLDASSENPVNKFLLNVFGDLAQLERGLTLQCQREGIEISKKEGKFKGRKLEVTLGGKKSKKALQALEWYQGVKSVRYM
ncbi:recombinase family protein [Sporosarcina sp. FSL K6-6792]|uniref:recombinase family protein n=1 Tax=Sporosarcina sp. FSL K6-6792 TaxID=2921559 RepID=UPI0030F91747